MIIGVIVISVQPSEKNFLDFNPSGRDFGLYHRLIAPID
jgi:hypothetical protein